MSDDLTGYALPVGSYEDARAMVGQPADVRFGHVDVNEAMVRAFCALVRDPNPSYWDRDYARAHWGGLPAPPAMLMTWVMPMEWQPGAPAPTPLLTARVPLPGDTIVNVSNDTEHLRPVLEGDRLSVTEELTDVSPQKQTSLGRGHFVTTATTYRRQDGEVVARMTNVLFRFTAREPSS